MSGWDERTRWVDVVRNYRDRPIAFELRRQWAGHVDYTAELEQELERLPEGPRSGPADDSWYWAAPVLLDQRTMDLSPEEAVSFDYGEEWGEHDNESRFHEHLVRAAFQTDGEQDADLGWHAVREPVDGSEVDDAEPAVRGDPEVAGVGVGMQQAGSGRAGEQEPEVEL